MNIQQIMFHPVGLREKDALLDILKNSSIFYTLQKVAPSTKIGGTNLGWFFVFRVDIENPNELSYLLRVCFNGGMKRTELDNISTSGS